jgi:hypothetical protein
MEVRCLTAERATDELRQHQVCLWLQSSRVSFHFLPTLDWIAGVQGGSFLYLIYLPNPSALPRSLWDNCCVGSDKLRLKWPS